jgi:hypothetical protein
VQLVSDAVVKYRRTQLIGRPAVRCEHVATRLDASSFPLGSSPVQPDHGPTVTVIPLWNITTDWNWTGINYFGLMLPSLPRVNCLDANGCV